ncbi:fatty-acyl-CoA synthase [Flexivirga endophytica]|uniref:Fatty-acyl-CoA synthase n=1 Tax=Flexivirga endophytica TaxID=1849103 RepID=A0A916TBF5_9MICO|nr:long-chain fatty acid--CoA ligase [Flexivirga endophytica]GGB37287.1 fatty-acyl-CoA synthase [Flexivirga endophytica]GHB44887.1 fatty-acyl-CoA synthase [Flexivirga endophytica]
MKDQGLGSWTLRRARMTPDKAALVQDGHRVSYRQLHLSSTRLARGLRGRGVAAGDRVAFLGLNSIELVTAMFATASLGAVFVPLNTRLAPPELRYVLTNSEPTIILAEDSLATGAVTAMISELSIPTVVFTRTAGAGLASLESDDERPLDEPIAQDDLFMIQYTSGTSGRPKGVQLTHGNIIWNVMNLMVDVDLGSEEVALVTAPLFHTAALNQVLFPTVLKGGTALIESRFDPDRAIELIESEGVTLLFGVTSMYLALSDAGRFGSADLSTLRNALSGGAPIPESLLRIWLDRGLMIVQGYGLTEASPGSTMLRAADGIRKLGSAGTACFFTDVRVIDGVGEIVMNEPGEVQVSGPNVTPGYWRDPSSTDTAFDGDWLHTGDLATTDDEGYLRIVGRLKDMYISGGENVYPVEIESALHEHPDVAEAAVIGIPDTKWGEVGRAFVVTSPGSSLDEAALIAHLEGRLARYKLPKSVVFLSELPHNASGKLLKSSLREVKP